MDTLRSIADGMEHKYPNHTRYRGGQLETFCGGGDCPKCRLEALLAEYEKVDLVKTWRGQVGSDTYENSVDCGNAGDVYSAGCNETLRENSAELETWLAVNLPPLQERIATLQPKADAYERVCKSLGIENDILGYIDRIRAEARLEQAKENDE